MIGTPITIVSTKADDIREMSLRREGDELYCIAKYKLIGSKSSAIVHAKSKFVSLTNLSNLNTHTKKNFS